MKWKGYGTEGLWPSWYTLCRNLTGVADLNRWNVSDDLGWDLVPGPPIFDAGMLTVQLRYSTKQCGYKRWNDKDGEENDLCVLRVTSGFRREVDENCALLRCYVDNSGNFLPTFRDNLSVPSKGVENLYPWPLKIGPISRPETSVRICHYSLRNDPEEHSSPSWWCNFQFYPKFMES